MASSAAPNYVPSQAALNAARNKAPTWGMGTYGLPAPNKALPGLSNRNAATNAGARIAVSTAVKSGAFEGGRRRKSQKNQSRRRRLNHKKQSRRNRH